MEEIWPKANQGFTSPKVYKYHFTFQLIVLMLLIYLQIDIGFHKCYAEDVDYVHLAGNTMSWSIIWITGCHIFSVFLIWGRDCRIASRNISNLTFDITLWLKDSWKLALFVCSCSQKRIRHWILRRGGEFNVVHLSSCILYFMHIANLFMRGTSHSAKYFKHGYWKFNLKFGTWL